MRVVFYDEGVKMLLMKCTCSLWLHSNVILITVPFAKLLSWSQFYYLGRRFIGVRNNLHVQYVPIEIKVVLILLKICITFYSVFNFWWYYCCSENNIFQYVCSLKNLKIKNRKETENLCKQTCFFLYNYHHVMLWKNNLFVGNLRS